jgi:predicted transcriptional regulator
MNKVLLLSIRPVHSEKIFSREKRVELRRLRPAVQKGDLVLVYTSSPSCELTGAFIVDKVDSAAPAILWEKVRASCGLTRMQYNAYYRGSKVAFGIRIERAWRLEVPLKLACLRRHSAQFHPPQSYRYFAPVDLGTLMPTVTARDLLRAGNGQPKSLTPSRRKRQARFQAPLWA